MNMYVSVVLTDGLGNRFFQVAAMLWFAERTGRTPLLIRDWMAADRHPAAKPLTSYFLGIPTTQSAPAGRWRIIRAPDAFAPPTDELLETADDRMSIRLEGWFQHVDFLPRDPRIYFDALRLLATASTPLLDYENTAFLHIRRGDYLHPACAHHRVDLRAYYGLALAFFSDDTKIVVVSDDLEWARATFPVEYAFVPESRWVFCTGLNDFQTLGVMVRCGKGGIVANSTFSWWGAFFGHAVNSRRLYTMPGTWGLPPLPAEVALYPDWATVLPV